MNLEELQAMSDAELNELSAVKVMGWKKSFVFEGQRYNGTFGEEAIAKNWNPTADMNDAYSLLQALIPTWTVSIGFNISGWEVGLWTGVSDGDKFVSVSDRSFPKSITIASILAKEEQK